jgi:FtsZ-binding cell division protein ZapB
MAHLEVEEIKEKRKDRESKTINVKHMRSAAENIGFKKS